MRFAVYNIRYGTGGGRILLPWSNYLRRTHRNLVALTAFLRSLDLDVLGLLEVDAGSYRSGKRNQAQAIAEALGHYHTYRSKYADRSLLQRVPVLNKQGNAFIARDSNRNEVFHYFDQGIKRLVIELELPELTIFLVHLALGYRVRQQQLSDLYSLVRGVSKPHVVAGDLNVFWGDRETRLFLAATGLCSADPRATATYPSWAPTRQLDFVLHSPDIRVRSFHVPQVTFSDHLPLVCDFGTP
ncbi:MAG: endonuclease/exonuclease/phosphatase family protein [Lentisphaeria bacterium]|nr:endonuclease/exonuclease/phosphatase family protein [Lentisphaeria bacterium]